MRPSSITSIAELRARLDADRASGRRVGFVPTMGFLHAGHLSLMRAARRDTDVVVASIFVNPLQFAANEDLATYPRDLERDTALAAEAGVDLLFVPTTAEMYPEPVLTTVNVPGLAAVLDGISRPTHFAGVATVVAKLFAIVGACRAYFGEKDFQQLQVVKRMATDLSLPVEVVGCPIVREGDGLAMSSRNVYLDSEHRQAATVLHRSLRAGATAIEDGVTDPGLVRDLIDSVLAAEPLAEPDYAAVVHPSTLLAPDVLTPGTDVRLLVAARVGIPRLIDNLGVTIPAAFDTAIPTPASARSWTHQGATR